MAVQRFLDASTAHITKADNDLLMALPLHTQSGPIQDFPVRVVHHAYGFWLNVPSDEWPSTRDALVQAGVSADLIHLMNYAHDNECWWINLDVDADLLDDFPQFEW